MLCPRCENSEIDGLKSCPICGFRVLADADDDPGIVKLRTKRNSETTGMIEMNYTDHPESPQGEPKDMPEWRQQVARRLQEIRQRRQSNGDAAADAAPRALPFPEPARNSIPTTTISLAKGAGSEQKPQSTPGIQAAAKGSVLAERRPASTRIPRRQPLTQNQILSKAPSAKTEDPSSPDEVSSAAGQAASTADPSEVKNLIDNVVIRRVITPSAKFPETVSAERRALSLTRYEDKLTLLSRAFAGMVDLIIIALCVGTFIFATDAFSGIVVVDAFSWINYCLLFLITYFVYSLFFLSTINQTVGMMITDLRVVDEQERRPPMRRILGRLSSFVPSFLILGAGLIWGIFDRESRCLHDRLSGTHVVRI